MRGQKNKVSKMSQFLLLYKLVLNSENFLTHEEFADSVSVPGNPAYIGAQRHTNNAGEISAIHFALWKFYLELKGMKAQLRRRQVLQIISDSEYSLHGDGSHDSFRNQ